MQPPSKEDVQQLEFYAEKIEKIIPELYKSNTEEFLGLINEIEDILNNLIIIAKRNNDHFNIRHFESYLTHIRTLKLLTKSEIGVSCGTSDP